MNLTCLLKKSQLHGINRLSESKDRLIWLIALILLFGAAITSLLIALWRFQSNPTFLTSKENARFEIAFPSVLICPELDFPESKMNQFLDEVMIPSYFNRSYLMGVLRQLATYYSPDVFYAVKDLDNLLMLLSHNDIDLEQAFLRLTSTCEEILLRCRWRGVIINCTKLFQMETMQFGVCCVFNGRSLKKDILSQGLPVRKPKVRFHVESVGYESGLTVAVNQGIRNNLRNIDLSYKWLILSQPQRFVESLTNNGTALSPGTEMWFGYKTYRFDVTEDSKTLSPDLRRCVLSATKLKLFPVYKRNYCKLECEMTRVLKKCKCSMPTQPYPNTQYCKPSVIHCAKDVIRQINFDNCNCLSTCDANIYETIINSYNLSTKPIDHFYDGLNYEEVTIVRVFIYKRKDTIKTRQSYFTSYDLFSQMGGIFSVFFGCSVLSILEISQLIWYSVKNRKAGKKSTQEISSTTSISNKKSCVKNKRVNFVLSRKRVKHIN